MGRKLNIGAGFDVKPKDEGWINCDVRADLLGIDYVCDARELPFADESFSEVVAYDLLEHLPPYDTERTLLEWRRVLMPEGILRLRVPALQKIARRFVSGTISDKIAVHLLYGDQSPKWGGTEYGTHRTGFTPSILKEMLTRLGFNVTRNEEHPDEHNQYVEALKPSTTSD